MIAGLKPYPAMKDSCVPWLGKVPGHWEVRRLKHMCAMRSGDAITAESINPAGDHPVYGGNGRRGYASSFTHDGEFPLVGRQGALCGNVHLARGKFWASEHAVVASPARGVVPSFLAWALGCMDLGRYSIAAAQPGLAVERILALPSTLPPLHEQAAIVRFLNHADRRIRRYIRAKQKLIKLLEEQKQAIIHRAVSRGLDPNVRLKPSGVEWLGEVPQHWVVRPAKWFYREVDERSLSGHEELLSVSHLTGVTPRSQKNITMFMAETYVGHKLCRPGDLVINTMWAWMAALGVARQTGLVSPSYGVYRPRQGSPLLAAYADLLFRTGPYVSEYVCRSTGIRSSRLRLYPEQFLRIPVVCPPVAEQLAILANVDSDTAETTNGAAAAIREIELLREYRTRLIADIVTGKLDVREPAARLPDEVEEPGALDEIESEVDTDEAGSDGADELSQVA